MNHLESLSERRTAAQPFLQLFRSDYNVTRQLSGNLWALLSGYAHFCFAPIRGGVPLWLRLEQDRAEKDVKATSWGICSISLDLQIYFPVLSNRNSLRPGAKIPSISTLVLKVILYFDTFGFNLSDKLNLWNNILVFGTSTPLCLIDSPDCSVHFDVLLLKLRGVLEIIILLQFESLSTTRQTRGYSVSLRTERCFCMSGIVNLVKVANWRKGKTRLQVLNTPSNTVGLIHWSSTLSLSPVYVQSSVSDVNPKTSVNGNKCWALFLSWELVLKPLLILLRHWFCRLELRVLYQIRNLL